MEPVLVQDERFQIEVEEEMEVPVHQPRNDVPAGGVDRGRVRRNRGRARRPGGGDAAVDDHDHAVGNGRGSRSVDHGASGDGHGLGRGARSERAGEEEGEGGRQNRLVPAGRSAPTERVGAIAEHGRLL